MKKLLLCSFLVLALLLVGCNNNKENTPDNDPNQNQVESENSNTPEYNTPDFTETAGFKVNLDESLKNVKYDSIFLMNDSIAQLDLQFPDNTIGTLLIDPTESSQIHEPDDAVFVGDTKVSVEIGADGIIVYEWFKNNYTFIYSSKTDIRNTETLTNLVNDVSIEVTEEL